MEEAAYQKLPLPPKELRKLRDKLKSAQCRLESMQQQPHSKPKALLELQMQMGRVELLHMDIRRLIRDLEAKNLYQPDQDQGPY